MYQTHGYRKPRSRAAWLFRGGVQERVWCLFLRLLLMRCTRLQALGYDPEQTITSAHAQNDLKIIAQMCGARFGMVCPVIDHSYVSGVHIRGNKVGWLLVSISRGVVPPIRSAYGMVGYGVERQPDGAFLYKRKIMLTNNERVRQSFHVAAGMCLSRPQTYRNLMKCFSWRTVPRSCA